MQRRVEWLLISIMLGAVATMIVTSQSGQRDAMLTGAAVMAVAGCGILLLRTL
jgi:hypothetical protein